MMGNIAYVAGGQSTMQDAQAMDQFWALDLESGQEWKVLPSWDGPPRVFTESCRTVQRYNKCVYLFSGRNVAPNQDTELLKDVYQYDITSQTWSRRADSPSLHDGWNVCCIWSFGYSPDRRRRWSFLGAGSSG